MFPAPYFGKDERRMIDDMMTWPVTLSLAETFCDDTIVTTLSMAHTVKPRQRHPKDPIRREPRQCHPEDPIRRTYENTQPGSLLPSSTTCDISEIRYVISTESRSEHLFRIPLLSDFKYPSRVFLFCVKSYSETSPVSPKSLRTNAGDRVMPRKQKNKKNAT
jgi:hypothetical protein